MLLPNPQEITMPTPVDCRSSLIPAFLRDHGPLEKHLDRMVPGWSTTQNLGGPVAIVFHHNQVLQVGVLRVEPSTADSKLSKKLSYREYFAKKGIHLQRGGLRFISVTNASGSKHPVELARVFDLDDTRLEIRARKDAQIGNERRVLLARNLKR